MNKKFSTLVAGLLLASAVSVRAEVYTVPKAATPNATIATVDPYANGVGGYEIGKAYLLGESANGKVLSVVEDQNTPGKYTLKYAAQDAYNKVDILYKAMWQLTEIVAPAGAVAPKYVFVNKATGEADRFNSVYQAYKKGKEVTIRRLYLETMENVLKKSDKVIVDPSAKGSNVLPVLPLNAVK